MEIAFVINQISVLILSAGSALMDIFTWRISNIWICVWCAAGFVFIYIFGSSEDIINSFAGMLIPVLLLGVLFHFGMMGAGDIKLLSAIGIWIGADDILICMLLSFAAGAAAAFIKIIIDKNGKERFSYLAAFLKNLKEGGNNYGAKKASSGRMHVSVLVLTGVIFRIAGVY